jgi:hypothetical protein
MKIKVAGYLTFRKLIRDQPFFQLRENGTVKDLLDKLSLEYGDAFINLVFDPDTKKVNRSIAILINGRHYSHLPGRINTELKAIFPPIAGG